MTRMKTQLRRGSARLQLVRRGDSAPARGLLISTEENEDDEGFQLGQNRIFVSLYLIAKAFCLESSLRKNRRLVCCLQCESDPFDLRPVQAVERFFREIRLQRAFDRRSRLDGEP
jgi:hypothetical protein